MNDISGSFFREQAQMLAAGGCEVGVIVPQLTSIRAPLGGALRSGVQFEMDGRVATWRGRIPNLAPRLLRAQARIAAWLTRHLYGAYVAAHGRPDILHVHSALLAGIGAVDLSETEGIPLVLSEHSSGYARGRVNRAGVELARRVATRASARFAVSAPFSAMMSQTLGSEVGRWEIMPNAVDATFLQGPLPSKQDGVFRFLHISLLDENKNVAGLLSSFARQFRGQLGIRLRIGGDGPDRNVLTVEAEALGIAPQVDFLGRLSREQVRSELGSCDAFVLSSRFETFGVVLIEALAMGRPVIATSCGGPEDIVTPETGLLVPVDDEAALGEAMVRMTGERGRYIPQDLRRHCSDHFGPQAMTSRWLEVYRDIVEAQVKQVADV